MTDQWDKKFLREQPFMPFGTMFNAYCQINQGKGCTPEEILMVADKLFEKAIELVKKSYNATTNEEESIDIPIKK